MSLEIEEFEIIRSLIPLILIVIIAWTRHASEFFVHFESLLDTKIQIIA